MLMFIPEQSVTCHLQKNKKTATSPLTSMYYMRTRIEDKEDNIEHIFNSPNKFFYFTRELKL